MHGVTPLLQTSLGADPALPCPSPPCPLWELKRLPIGRSPPALQPPFSVACPRVSPGCLSPLPCSDSGGHSPPRSFPDPQAGPAPVWKPQPRAAFPVNDPCAAVIC
ncbi:Hypothetical predicted protein [Marmota monax]|uniref:Uncharacterized protein n=1 Tax=Marmota monax TaxID=9995 RepID=A0A5E4CNZ7_MARMO|nr:hypothetical protein GHT09_011368 [Marmota monax]VTJ82741.1 Hypothetical predicted protein [Marmota monax]